MHTCRCDTDASSSGLTCTCRVATAIVETEGMGGFSVTNDGLADLDQSLKGLEIDCTALKKAPASEVTGRFKTNNRPSGRVCRRGGGGLNRGAAASGGKSGGGGGPKGFTRGGSFGSLALWAWVMPWLLLLVLGGMESVNGVAIPDCTYAVFANPGCMSESCWNARTCGIRQAVDTYTTQATIDKYGPIEDWNTSLVTDMSRVFSGKSSFNANISAWQVGKVTTMERSTYTLSLLAASIFPLFFL
jgi:surface protein